MKKNATMIFLGLLILFGCQSEENNNVSKNDTIIVNLEKDGFSYLFKSIEAPVIITKSDSKTMEEYYLSVSKEDKKIESIIVKKNLDELSYIVYHYTIDKQLFATIFVKDAKIIDIKLELDNNPTTKGFSSWYECTNAEYKRYKEWYATNHEVVCDIADIFLGACTVTGAVQAGVRCLF